MLFVLLASHGPEICPLSNAKTREATMKRAPEMPALAQRLGVRLVGGPYVSREHLAVFVVEAEKAEAVDEFISQSGMAQWNRIRVLPSITMEQAMKEVNATTPIF